MTYAAAHKVDRENMERLGQVLGMSGDSINHSLVEMHHYCYMHLV